MKAGPGRHSCKGEAHDEGVPLSLRHLCGDRFVGQVGASPAPLPPEVVPAHAPGPPQQTAQPRDVESQLDSHIRVTGRRRSAQAPVHPTSCEPFIRLGQREARFPELLDHSLIVPGAMRVSSGTPVTWHWENGSAARTECAAP